VDYDNYYLALIDGHQSAVLRKRAAGQWSVVANWELVRVGYTATTCVIPCEFQRVAFFSPLVGRSC
jgi:hypothetical protein